jgi:hypothetical protein
MKKTYKELPMAPLEKQNYQLLNDLINHRREVMEEEPELKTKQNEIDIVNVTN